MFNRRQLLKTSAVAAMVPFLPLGPQILQAQAGPEHDGQTRDGLANNQGRILVVIQMSGGNDGINTVVPYADENYAKSRPTLGLRGNDLIEVNDRLALNAAIRGAADLLEDGRLAVVQGVGYPNPNRSHDVSMAIWQTARLTKDKHASLGWIGRATDTMDHVPAGTPHSILMGNENPPTTLQGRRSFSGAFAHPSDLRLDPLATLVPNSQATIDNNSLLAFAQRSMRDALSTAERVQTATQEDSQTTNLYPTTQLAKRLKSIGQLIKSGFETPVYYAIQSGYDTHIAQRARHGQLLAEWSGALKGFLDDMRSSGLEDRVAVLSFSEFGRRVAENASEGTDHGAAGPVFLAGSPIQGGFFGETPKLDAAELFRGDLRSTIDFRQVYATLLTDWFGMTSTEILGNINLSRLGLFR